MRPSIRFRDILRKRAGRFPESMDRPVRVRVNRHPSLGYSYELFEDELVVHISDLLLENSPDEVLEVMAHMVLLDAYRDAYSSSKRLMFEGHRRRLANRDDIIRELLLRDRRIKLEPGGRRFDLRERFDAVNAEYFQGRVPRVNLAWSARADRKRWGYCDRDRKLIVVNNQLDRPGVPRHVVDYIIYHEMLHLVHKGLLSSFGREDHYVDFYRDERKFEKYEEAEEWLKRN